MFGQSQVWGVQPAAAVDSNLIGWWTLSMDYNNNQHVLATEDNYETLHQPNNTIMYDYSNNGTNAEYYGVPNSSTPYGAIYGSYPTFAKFGSGGFVQVNYLPRPAQYTVSAWAAVSGQMTGNFNRILEWGTYNNGIYLGTDQSAKHYQVIVNNGSSAGNYGNCVSPNLIDTSWHLVTATFDGANANLFVDGVKVAGPCAFSSTPQPVGNYTPVTDYSARIGCYNDSLNKGFGGYTALACSSVSGSWGAGTPQGGFIGGVRIYGGEILTPAQMLQIYFAEDEGFSLLN